MEVINKQVWVYDIETIKSVFTYCAINIDTQEVVKFVIHKDLDQREELFDHLKSCRGQIGFNNISFDYPILHYFLTDYFYRYCTTEELIQLLYSKAQEIIELQNKPFGQYSNTLWEKDFIIAQLDLFKLWHYNNKARTTSLKSLQISMNYDNVLEMPISHTEENVTLDQIESILEYNLNDVLSTYEFYKKSLDKIALRKELNKKYNLKCLNFPDSKIGESLVLKLYCDKTNSNTWDIKKLRTQRNTILVKDCIFPYIKFKSKEFNDALNNFNNFVISKKEIEEKSNSKKKKLGSCIYKGFKYDFGLGGIHGCIKPGIYEAIGDYIIIDADVSSLYPSIAIVNKLYPEHLGPIFYELYEKDIVDVRMAAKAKGDMIISDGFKLSANAIYGKSKDKYSFLYDPLYTMKTTINGQFMISMLCEELVTDISDIQMLQVNTKLLVF